MRKSTNCHLLNERKMTIDFKLIKDKSTIAQELKTTILYAAINLDFSIKISISTEL